MYMHNVLVQVHFLHVVSKRCSLQGNSDLMGTRIVEASLREQ